MRQMTGPAPLKEAQRQETLSIAQQAEEWRQILATAGPKEHAAFLAWVQQSPLHLREALIAEALDEALDRIDPQRQIDVAALSAKAKTSSNVAPLRHQGSQSREEISRHRAGWPGAIAASVIVAGATIFAIVRFPSAETYTTAVGEQRMLELEDGSVVFLNTKSKMRTDFSDTARDIYLGEGQALFQVKHDASRPFRVHTEAATIQALGTKFDVRRFNGGTAVAVVEGVVALIPELPVTPITQTEMRQLPTKVAAGEGATISAVGEISTAARIDPVVTTAWRRQQLIFRDDTLDFIASEFNRYNSAVRLRVEGNARTKRFNGVFNIHNPESLVRFLGQEQDLEFQRHGDNVIIRERPVVASGEVVP